MLVAFHSDCDSIYKIVENIGVTIREIRELEDQVISHFVEIILLKFCLFKFRSKLNHKKI
jgi:hypothetical protein